jgi:hypothetical protein
VPSVNRPRPLSDDLARIEFHEHGSVRLQVLDGHGQAKVVEEKELQLQVVQFRERKTANLEPGKGYVSRRSF